MEVDDEEAMDTSEAMGNGPVERMDIDVAEVVLFTSR